MEGRGWDRKPSMLGGLSGFFHTFPCSFFWDGWLHHQPDPRGGSNVLRRGERFCRVGMVATRCSLRPLRCSETKSFKLFSELVQSTGSTALCLFQTRKKVMRTAADSDAVTWNAFLMLIGKPCTKKKRSQKKVVDGGRIIGQLVGGASLPVPFGKLT